MSDKKILEVKSLSTSFFTHVGEVKAVRDISFDVNEGEILGIVGESGSGKSVSCISIMRLLGENGTIKEGEALFKGEDLFKKSSKEMQKIRGDEMSMVFQDPMTSLNPVFTVGHQMMEVIREHQDVSKEEARKIAISMLEKVGIPSPEDRLKSYPHEFSGGMRQRVVIALALSCNPDLIIADEPTTALDVTIQAQVLELMQDLQKETGTSIILITHDLGVVAETCQRVIVMYGGMKMEEADVKDLFASPQNPYTVGLLQSVPNPHSEMKERLIPIPGSPPDLVKPPEGCPFSPRCEHAMRKCAKEVPPLFDLGNGHSSRCWLMHEDAPVVDGYKKAVK